MPFAHRLRVRYHECDAQGIVFNANHFAYFDVALTELWRDAFGSYASMLEAGVDVLVRDAGATFHAPARFDEEIDLEFRVAKLGTTSMISQIDERRGSDLLVEGRMVHVFVDATTHEKRPIPDDVRAVLERYASPPGD